MIFEHLFSLDFTLQLPRWLRGQICQPSRVQSLGGEDPLEKEMATHSSMLAWKIPWTEESGGLVMGSQRFGNNCTNRIIYGAGTVMF